MGHPFRTAFSFRFNKKGKRLHDWLKRYCLITNCYNIVLEMPCLCIKALLLYPCFSIWTLITFCYSLTKCFGDTFFNRRMRFFSFFLCDEPFKVILSDLLWERKTRKIVDMFNNFLKNYWINFEESVLIFQCKIGSRILKHCINNGRNKWTKAERSQMHN